MKKLHEQYYNHKLSNDDKRGNVKYVGKNITWYGLPGRMAIVPVKYIRFLWGNIFDPEKTKSLINMIKTSDENIEIKCAYALANHISITSIIETQEAFVEGRFETDYEDMVEPYTIGDEDMDKYLGTTNVDELDMFYRIGEAEGFIEKYRFKIATGQSDPDKVMKVAETYDWFEDEKEYIESFIEMETNILEAIERNDGDLARPDIQLRDGNHRALAAMNVGEDYICVNINESMSGMSLDELGKLITIK